MVFNLISFALGLAAVALAAAGFSKNARRAPLMSAFACALALLFQICEYNRRVGLEDWTALMDTSKAAVNLSICLTMLVLGLNMLSHVLRKK